MKIKYIVHPDEVMDKDEILFENLTLADLRFEEQADAIHWAATRRLIQNSVHCQNCSMSMHFVLECHRKDGYKWRCSRCDKRMSIRYGSFLARSMLSIKQLLIIVYCWARDFKQDDTNHEAQIARHGHTTTSDWYCFLREVCEQYLIDHPTVIGGLGENCLPKTVEISESQYYNRKYREPSRDVKWVFRGIEKESGKCFIVEVPDKNAKTLTSIIQRYVLPGSIVVTDSKKHYNLISKIGGGVYEHHVKDNFDFGPVEDGDQLKNILCQAKKRRRKSVNTEALFTSYIHEYMWRNQYGRHNNIFGQILVTLGRQCPT